jgi:hypothetical protein
MSTTCAHDMRQRRPRDRALTTSCFPIGAELGPTAAQVLLFVGIVVATADALSVVVFDEE